MIAIETDNVYQEKNLFFYNIKLFLPDGKWQNCQRPVIPGLNSPNVQNF